MRNKALLVAVTTVLVLASGCRSARPGTPVRLVRDVPAGEDVTGWDLPPSAPGEWEIKQGDDHLHVYRASLPIPGRRGDTLSLRLDVAGGRGRLNVRLKDTEGELPGYWNYKIPLDWQGLRVLNIDRQQFSVGHDCRDWNTVTEMALEVVGPVRVRLSGVRFFDSPTGLADAANGDSWRTVEVGKSLDEQGIALEGTVLYRKMFRAPEDFEKATLCLCGADELAWVYLDGDYVGKHFGWERLAKYDLTDRLRPGRVHCLVVKLYNADFAGGLWRPVLLADAAPEALPEQYEEFNKLLEAGGLRTLALGPTWQLHILRDFYRSGGGPEPRTAHQGIQAAPLPGEWADKGYVVFTRPPFVMSNETAIPGPGEITSGLHLDAFPGEHQPVTFFLLAKEKFGGLSVAPTDLLCAESGRTIPAAQVNVRLMKFWWQSGTYVIKGRPVYVPELLLKDDRGELKGLEPEVRLEGPATTEILQNQTRQFWVDVAVSGGTPEGVYEGWLEMRGGINDRIKLTVRVLPDLLRPVEKSYCIYWRGRPDSDGIEGIGEERWLAQAENIREHQFNRVWPYVGSAELEEALRTLHALGFREPVLGSVSDEESGRKKMEAARAAGYQQPFFYGCDEPGSPDALEMCKGLFEAARAVGGRTTTAICFSALISNPGLAEVTDCPNLTNFIDDAPLGVSRRLAIGKKVWEKPFWYYWQSMREDPRLNRLFCGYLLEKFGADGVFPYGYQHVMSPDPFDDFEGPTTGTFRDHMTTYPSAHGPIDTHQWEAAREGIDDLRLYLTLKDWVSRRRTEPSREALYGAKLAAAEELIEAIESKLYYAWGESQGFLDAYDFDLWRREMIRHVLALSE